MGALVAHAYKQPRTAGALIYGTGVNAAYNEKVARIRKLSHYANNENKNGSSKHASTNGDMMLLNTELDIFGSPSYLPLTRFDISLDQSHSQPDFQPYEKMMSGAYLGELTRLIAVELIDQRYLFDGHVPAELQEPWQYTTAAMSDFEGYLIELLFFKFSILMTTFFFFLLTGENPTKTASCILTCRFHTIPTAKVVRTAL